MKLFLVSNMYPSLSNPNYGVFVKNFIKNLNDSYQVKFVLSIIKGKKVTIFHKLFFYLIHYLEIIIKGVFCNYDLIYLHYISHSAAPVLFIKFMTKKPLVINAHGSDVISNNKFRRLNLYFIRKLVSHADGIVVPSLYYKKIMLNQYDIEESKFFISPSGGVNSSTFYNIDTKSNQFTLGYVSRIDPGKGWDIFLSALYLLNKEFDIHAIIVGDGIDKKTFKERIKKYKLNNIINYHGMLPQNDLNVIYNKLDLFIFPTIRTAESLGLVGLEAMSCGVPVIGSDIGGPSEYIVPGYNGYKFKPGDVNDLVMKIKRFKLLSSDIKKNMKNNCVIKSRDYDTKSVTKNIYDYLNKLSEKN